MLFLPLLFFILVMLYSMRAKFEGIYLSEVNIVLEVVDQLRVTYDSSLSKYWSELSVKDGEIKKLSLMLKKLWDDLNAKDREIARYESDVSILKKDFEVKNQDVIRHKNNIDRISRNAVYRFLSRFNIVPTIRN